MRVDAVEPIEGLTRRDRLVSSAYRAANLAKLGRLVLRRGLGGVIDELQRYPWLKTLARINSLHDTLTRGRSGLYRDANAFLITNITSSIVEMVEGVFYRREHTVIHEDLVPPELLLGMGLQPWMAEFLGIVIPIIDSRIAEEWIDVAESWGVPADVCSLPKSTTGLALSGCMPQPAAIVASNMPCDGGMSQYSIIERRLGVPAFRLDVPYDFYSDRAVEFFTSELRRLIKWLEEHTPGRMDWDRLRAVCDERNRAMEHELELWDLVRHRPAPLAGECVYLSHLMYGIAQPGTKRGTKVFETLAALARKNLEAGRGALSDEQYRAVLWNPPTMVAFELPAWAERVYGVALVMDMLSYHRHPFIDTRTPETMLRGLAQVIMQGPMARHTRGKAANFFGDLFRICDEFDVDMIWMAAHIGCKNTQALLGMLRERCRHRRQSLLVLDYDLSDSRIVSPEDLRRQTEQFMETVMQASPVVDSSRGTGRGSKR